MARVGAWNLAIREPLSLRVGQPVRVPQRQRQSVREPVDLRLAVAQSERQYQSELQPKHQCEPQPEPVLLSLAVRVPLAVGQSES